MKFINDKVKKPLAILGIAGIVASSPGCATYRETGTATGAGAGALIGALSNKGNTLFGGLVGALIGGLAGYVVGNEMDRAQAAKETARYEKSGYTVVEIKNPSGSYTPVPLAKTGVRQYQAPNGEIYTNGIPTEEQLRQDGYGVSKK